MGSTSLNIGLKGIRMKQLDAPPRAEELKEIRLAYIKKQEHVDNVKKKILERDEKIKAGTCPRCGGKLTLRTGKYGQFYGCSNYPKCGFTLKQS